MTDRNEVGENLTWDRSLSLSYSERASFIRKKLLQTKAAWVQFQRGTDLRSIFRRVRGENEFTRIQREFCLSNFAVKFLRVLKST